MSCDKGTQNDKTFTEHKPAVSTDYSTFSKLLPSYDGSSRTLVFYIDSENVDNALNLIANTEVPCIAFLIRRKLSDKVVEALSQSPGAKTRIDIKEALFKKIGKLEPKCNFCKN